MKFLNFFKSTAGIIIIILVVIAIILVFMNWDSIKAWWNTPSVTSNGSALGGQGRFAGSGGTSARGICVNYGGGNCSYYGISVPCSECSKRGITIS